MLYSEVMDQDSSPADIATQPRPRTSGKAKKIVLILVVLLLIGGAGAGAWYYQQQNIDELKAKVAALEQTNQQLAEQAEAQPAETVYEAEIGKFKLSLPDGYVIIEKLDGAFEGGPATQIVVAKQTDSANVIDNGITSEVAISATPLQSDGFEQRVEQDTAGRNPTPQPDITIDGVKAQVYTLEGLFSEKVAYFSKNNIFYKITLNDTNETTDKVLADVTEGFKFN